MDPAVNDLYRQRLGRYTAAMRNQQPDCVPIRPFVAEFTTVFAGYTCQQTAHDYTLGFDAALRTAQAHDWDAVVPNMIATWTGMTQALGLKYYMTPGIDVPAHVGHQYLEPSEDQAFMQPDEYDALIADPTGFLYEVWLPRVSSTLCPIGTPVTPGHNLTLVKGSMAMMEFFSAWARQEQRLKDEAGMPAAIAGILKAPIDVIADKLRGYVGLTMDIFERPEKVQAACEALAPTCSMSRSPHPIRRATYRSASGCIAGVYRLSLPRPSPSCTGPRSNRSLKNSGGTGDRPCSMRKETGTTTWPPLPSCRNDRSSITSTKATSSKQKRN